MIFTLILLSLLSKYVVNGASVEVGSQLPPVASQIVSNNSSSSSINIRNVSNNRSSSATDSQNDPPEDQSSQNGRRLHARQVSSSEWIFSSLVQPDQIPPSLSTTQQQSGQQTNRRGNSGLTYRSIAPMVSSSNYYTHYYRNHNIYAQTPRRIDGGDEKPQSKRRYNGVVATPDERALHLDNEGVIRPAAGASENLPPSGLGRRRTSSLSTINDVNGINSATPKMPEVLSDSDLGTTGLSRTAPATDPTLLITERSTSTQEMQISNDESSNSDDIQFGARAEIGRGVKRGRHISDEDSATESLQYEDSAPIVFPGKTTVSDNQGTLRPYIRPGKSGESYIPSKVNPFDARLIDGWKKLYELRKKSQSFGDAKKSSVASDQSADAKLISMLTIHGTPKCASKDGWCESIDTYPRSFFNQVLNKTLSPDIFKDIFGETTENNSVVTDVEFKLRYDLEDTPLCSVREHTIYPKAAQNRKGKFMYIVNHDDYLQGIRVETCTRENDVCMFTEGHPPGYTSTCKQKFIYKKLLAFTPEGKAMPDTFKLPSCCVCHVKSQFISDRINPGADVGNADVQPTVAADDGFWNPSSTSTFSYHPHETTSRSSTEPDDSSGITFPSTSTDDLSSAQVSSPTSSTSSPHPGTHQQQTGGQQHNRAENQTSSRRL